MKTITFKTKLPFPPEAVFAWHLQKGAFDRLLPPWEKVELVSYPDSIKNSAEVKLRCYLGSLPILNQIYFNWHLRHADFELNKTFSDLQVSGPFKSYKHTHSFISQGTETLIEDCIQADSSFSFVLNQLSHRLAQTFQYRESVLKNDLEFHSQFNSQKRLSFLIAGASGNIGKALCSFLTTAGHQVTRIVRNKSSLQPGDILLSNNQIELGPQAKYDCVINLAGAGIADKVWSENRRKELIESRVNFTKILIDAVKKLKNLPECLLSVSGVGFYNDNKCSDNTENSPKGCGFLSDLCANWEDAAFEALPLRVCVLRLAVVLDPKAGALKMMLPAFYAGLGASMSDGQQKMSWVSLDDVLRTFLFLAFERKLSGVFNVCSPQIVSNHEFTKILAKTLNRPAIFKVPAKILKFAFGEMARQTLLTNSDCKPQALINNSYKFLYPELRSFLYHCLGKDIKNYDER